jgi:hypothetical protein
MCDAEDEGSAHELGEEQAVEVVRLTAVRASKHGCEEAHLLDHQVLIVDKAPVSSIEWALANPGQPLYSGYRLGKEYIRTE